MPGCLVKIHAMGLRASLEGVALSGVVAPAERPLPAFAEMAH